MSAAVGVPTPPVASIPNYHFASATRTTNTTGTGVSASAAANSSKPIAAIKFSHDGKYLATGGADAVLRIYRIQLDGATPTLALYHEFPNAHDSGINDLVWTYDNKYLITASDDRNLLIWDVESKNVDRTYKGHTSYVFCCNVSALGNLVVSGSYDETIRVWDLKNAKCVRIISAHSDPVSAVDFNRDGSLIVSSSYDGLCRVWDTSSGRCLKTIYYDKTPPVSFVRFSPNGKYILASSLDSTLRLWDYSRKDHCVKEYTGHVNSKFCLNSCFSTLHATRQYIVSGSEDGRIVWWDVSTKEIVFTIQPRGTKKEPVLCVAVHPKLPIIASTSMEAPFEIVLWKHQDAPNEK